MKNYRSIIRYLPLAVGIIILIVAAAFVPWRKVGPYLTRLNAVTIIALFALSAVYYLGRIMRYYLILRMLDQPLKFSKVAIACLVAQPIAVLPGGELYRGAMLKRYGNVSLKTGAPSVFAQSIAESVGLLIIALIGGAVIHRYLLIILGLCAIFFVIIGVVNFRTHSSHKILNRLPFVYINPHRLRAFMDKNRRLLSGYNFIILIIVSYITAASGVGMIYLAAHELGSHLGLMQSAIAYALPTALETVSFLPGGLGVNEGGSIGVLTLFHLGLPLAIALTIIVRLFTLGIGFFYGFAAMGYAKLVDFRRYN